MIASQRSVVSRKTRHGRGEPVPRLDRGRDATGGTGVTVVLPSYNARSFVVDQVESILNQTHPPDLLVIIDDCSQDGTFELLAECFSSEPRVTLGRNPRNIGQERTIELMLSMVDTPYFAISDHDDVWLPRKLEVSMAALLTTEADLVYSDLVIVNHTLERVAPSALRFSKMRPVRGKCPMALLVRNPVHGCTVLGRRELLDFALPSPEAIPHFDRWLALVAASRGGIAFVEDSLVLYRQHGENVVGGVKPGMSGLRGNVRARGMGSIGRYLKRRMTERIAMTEALLASDLGGRSLRVVRTFYMSSRLAKAALVVPYLAVMVGAFRQSGISSMCADVALSMITPRVSMVRQHSCEGVGTRDE